jgi:hypothetical protein
MYTTYYAEWFERLDENSCGPLSQLASKVKASSSNMVSSEAVLSKHQLPPSKVKGISNVLGIAISCSNDHTIKVHKGLRSQVLEGNLMLAIRQIRIRVEHLQKLGGSTLCSDGLAIDRHRIVELIPTFYPIQPHASSIESKARFCVLTYSWQKSFGMLIVCSLFPGMNGRFRP